MCFTPQRRALFQHVNFQKWSEPAVFVDFDFEMCFAPQRRALFEHLIFQKCSGPGVFCTCLLRNVLRAPSRHNGVPFCHIATSKSVPALMCCVHFDFETCFAPQTACNFSSLICPDGSAPVALASLLFDSLNHKSLENRNVS